jgi:hypothetical protein
MLLLQSALIRCLCLGQARGFVASLEAASVNGRDVGLVRSVMAAGFYPLVYPLPALLR